MSNKPSTDESVHKVIAKAWADPAFKSKLLKEPNSALKSLGIDVPAGIAIRIHEDTPAERHYVLPLPKNAGLSDSQLESVAGGTLTTSRLHGQK